MSGNMREWTTEYSNAFASYGLLPCVHIGGYYFTRNDDWGARANTEDHGWSYNRGKKWRRKYLLSLNTVCQVKFTSVSKARTNFITI